MQNTHAHLLFLITPVITSCADEHGLFTDLGIVVLFGIIGGLVIVVWQGINRHRLIEEKKRAIMDALKDRKDFTESKVIKGDGENSFYLATDDTRKKVFYVFGDQTLLFDYKDIEAVQIKENGSIIVSKVSTESALLGALIGDAVLGGKQGGFLGASAFGKVTDQKQITSMYVHVSLRNQPLSSIDFKCFDNDGRPLSQGHYRVSYKLATIRAQELYDLFQTIIDEVDTERREEEKRIETLQKEEEKQAGKEMNRIIAAQEMIDMAGLFMSGKLSDEEYAKKKEEIIGKG